MRRFLAVDLLTAILLLVGLLFFPNHLRIAGTLIMALLGVVDLGWNRKFFFHPNSWRSTSELAEAK
jgi:hypothetical protein